MVTILDCKPNVVIDTSSLIEDVSVLRKAFEQYKNVIIHITTIKELDNLKTSKDAIKSKKARKALKEINSLEDKLYFCLEINVVGALKNKATDDDLKNYNPNDDIILSCAYLNDADICTEDLALKIKAKFIGVMSVSLSDKDKIYKGYQIYKFNSEEYNNFFMNKEDYYKYFNINEYLIIVKTDYNNKTDEYRFDGTGFVRLKLPSSKTIKAENVLQRCALDMLNNNDIDICAILGTYGSGKTYLSLRMALNMVKDKGNQSKILGVREAVGEGERIGFLKGDFDDKTRLFFKPLVQSLDGGEYELQELIDKGCFESIIPFYMKGTTYNDTIIVCDEAEDLSERQVRLIGTRLGNNSRVFFSGDYKQSIFDATTSNSLVKMCQELKGNPKFACIYLDTDVRSEGSKIFANLYKNTL